MFSSGSTLIQGQVDPPGDRRCQNGGHVAEEGVRFFYVRGTLLPREHTGIYCEPCLSLANAYLTQLKAEGRAPKVQKSQPPARSGEHPDLGSAEDYINFEPE